MRIILNENNFCPLRSLLRSHALNVYKINLYHYFNFMQKFNSSQSPIIFNDLNEKLNRTSRKNFSDKNFILKEYSVNSSKYSVSVRGPKIWNKFLKKKDKMKEKNHLFNTPSKKKKKSNQIKSKLLEIENNKNKSNKNMCLTEEFYSFF